MIIVLFGTLVMLLLKLKDNKDNFTRIFLFVGELFLIIILLSIFITWSLNTDSTIDWNLSKIQKFDLISVKTNFIKLYFESWFLMLTLFITISLNLVVKFKPTREFIFEIPIKTISSTVHVAISFIVGLACYTWKIDDLAETTQVYLLFAGLFILWILIIGLIFWINFLFDTLNVDE